MAAAGLTSAKVISQPPSPVVTTPTDDLGEFLEERKRSNKKSHKSKKKLSSQKMVPVEIEKKSQQTILVESETTTTENEVFACNWYLVVDHCICS